MALLEGVESMTDAVDGRLDEAFASLDEVPVRELMATAEAVGRDRRHPLHDFASIFRGVASAREGGWGTDRVPRFHLREAVSRADEQFAEQIADAPAPFWRHVRDALQAE